MRLDLHILRAHTAPFLFSLAMLMFIFILQFLMRAVEQLVGKGLGPVVITQLIVLSLAWMVVLAVPMAVLVATIMAFGRLSSLNEITAMKASGMSFYRMMALVLVCAVGLFYLLIQFNNEVLPESNHKFKTLMMDIRRKKPTLAILPGLFSQDLPGYSILARKTFQYSNDLEGLTIYDYTDPTVSVVVTAERGRVQFTPDYRKLIMDLENGEIHQLNATDLESYRRLRFSHHRIVMPTEGFDFERTSENLVSRGDRELSAQVMRAYVDSLERVDSAAAAAAAHTVPVAARTPRGLQDPHADTTRPRARAITAALNDERALINEIENQELIIRFNQSEINSKLVEIDKKYAIPFACIVFVFIGAPLGMMARRGTFGVGASLSIGFFVLYWASLIGGEKLADRGFIAPWIGMWFANIVLGILGIFLTLRMGRETPTINWVALRRLVPAALRVRESAAEGGGNQL